MKKILLTLLLVSAGFSGKAQVVCSGVSPASIQGNYLFGVQTDYGWPRYNGFGGPTSENWNLSYDFSIPGTYIIDTLVLVNDGTPGVNATYGNLLAEEGCNPSPANAYNGKIAILRRNTCDFATKAKHAQDAGAVAVVIVDRVDNENRENNYLSADAAGDGPSVTIPVIMLNLTEGNNLINAMQSDDVVMFIGNKLGAFDNDLGTRKSEVLIAPFAATPAAIDAGFDIGCTIYNYGALDQTNIIANATITGPSGTVYNQSINLGTLDAGDSLYLFQGETFSFPSFDLAGVYPVGNYTLTYTLSSDETEDLPYDNTFSSAFKITDDIISLARTDASGNPIATSYPFGSIKPDDYQSCMFFQRPDASNLTLNGISFVPYADTSVSDLEGAEIFINIYAWNDAWTDLNDAAYFGTAATQNPFATLNVIDYQTYYPLSNDETGDPVYVPFTPFQLVDNQRYLFCLQSYDTTVVFGYDGTLNYDGNQWVSAMPISPVKGENASNAPTWYAGGWSSISAPSIALNVTQLGIKEENTVNGKAFPNPSNGNVTISLEATGNGQLTVTDVYGRTALNQAVSLINGQTNVDLSGLDKGVYIFNITLENGQTSQFNVVKN